MVGFIEDQEIIYTNKFLRFLERVNTFIKKYSLSKKGCIKQFQTIVKHGASKGENTIWEWLKANTIDFIYQKKFEDCKDKNPLPFDFYLPTYNLCIEFQGSQHYDPGFYIRIKKNKEEGLKKFNIQKYHDELKRIYCKENNINFLEIKYNENIERVLKEELL